MPIAAVVASSLALTPVIVSPTPHALAAELLSSSKRIVQNAGEAVGDAATRIEAASVTAVGVLAASPSLLKSIDVHDLATFVALPQASVPLLAARSNAAVANSGSNPAANSPSIAEASPVSIAAADPVADLLAALQTIGGTISDAIVGAPGKIVQSLGLALDGNVREALTTLTNIIVEPLVLIGILQLPDVTDALAQIIPPLAPLFKAVPDALISAALPLVQGVADFNDTISGAFEGFRDGLRKGDLVAAVGGLLQGAATGISKGLSNFLGPDGFFNGLAKAGKTIVEAIGQVLGLPATTSSLAASKLASPNGEAVKTDKDVAVGSTRSVTPGAPIAGTAVGVDAGAKANTGLSGASTASENHATASGALGTGANENASGSGATVGATSGLGTASGTPGSATAGGATSGSGAAGGAASGSGAASGATSGSAAAGGATSGSGTAGGAASGSGTNGGTHASSGNAGGTSGSGTAGGAASGSGTTGGGSKSGSGTTGGKHPGSASSGSGGAGSTNNGSSNSGGKAGKSSSSAGAHGGTNGGSAHGAKKGGGAN